MKLRHHYLLLAMIGLVLPYSQFIPWIAEHHALSMLPFFRDLTANRISTFFAMDVVISAVVALLFIQHEGKRLGLSFLWIPSLGTCLVGVSFGLPLFLYLRQLELDRAG